MVESSFQKSECERGRLNVRKGEKVYEKGRENVRKGEKREKVRKGERERERM